MMLCCGCTLRLKTQFLLWSELITSTGWLLHSTIAIHYHIRNKDDSHLALYYGYYVLWSVIGVTTTVLGLWAIKNQKPLFLIGFLYYLYYYVFFESCCMIILIFKPTLYNDIFKGIIQKEKFIIKLDTFRVQHVILIAGWYLVLIGNLIYFSIIVKSYRDKMVNLRAVHSLSKLFRSPLRASLRRYTTDTLV